jgi:protein-L-isoaspartate(D-aspartate) O-methyltransferase
MIEAQLRANQVRDERVISAMGRLPREAFVPTALGGVSYVDEDIEVSSGRYLTEPMILGRLLDALKVQPEDRALDIAPATGYSTAVLSALAREVIAVEGDPVLADAARENLKNQGITNVRIEQTAITAGCPSAAPYDAILINGCVEFLPEALLAQLAEGGRLAAVVREKGVAAHVGEARLYTKCNGAVFCRTLFNANTKLLSEFAAPARFVF